MFVGANDLRHCIVCFRKNGDIEAADMIMVMGNKETQNIGTYGYCAQHAYNMIQEFHNKCLYIVCGDETHEHVDEALVQWSDLGAYYL